MPFQLQFIQLDPREDIQVFVNQCLGIWLQVGRIDVAQLDLPSDQASIHIVQHATTAEAWITDDRGSDFGVVDISGLR